MYESINPSRPLSHSQAAWRVISEFSGISTLTGTRERDREGWAHIETLRRLGYHKEAEAARKELIYGWPKEASAELVMVGWGSVVTPATTPVKRMTVPAKQGTTVAAEIFNRAPTSSSVNFSREPKSLIDQLVLDAAKQGRG